MRQTVFRDLHTLYPDRIVNKTNGITFRRWLFEANPRLTGCWSTWSATAVLDDPRRSTDFAKHADDTGVARPACRHPARQQGGAGDGWRPPTVGIRLDPDRRCSTCRSSASTNTSGSC